MRRLSMALLTATSVLVGSTGTAVALAQTGCADLGGTIDPDQTCRGHVTNPTYTLDFSFPVDYPDEQAVTSYLTQTRDGFVNVAEMPGSRNLPYELDATATGYRSGVAPGGTRSVVLKIFQDVGGAHPQTWYKAFNYDVGKGAPITFDGMFNQAANPLDVIFPIVEQDLRRQSGLDRAVLPGQGLDASRYQNFAITDDSVIFFFGQGELLPEAAGAIQAAVPRSALSAVLA